VRLLLQLFLLPGVLWLQQFLLRGVMLFSCAAPRREACAFLEG
jgi:hypothetical protein